jgi:hypothetical protein
MALTAYKAPAEVIFDRLINVTRVCQIIKPLLTLKKCKKFNWSHQAMFTFIRSASNIFRMQLLGEFYDLKSKLLESEENIIREIEGNTTEEKTFNIIKWFMHIDVSTKPNSQTSLDLNVKGTEHQKRAHQKDVNRDNPKRRKRSYNDKEKKSNFDCVNARRLQNTIKLWM